MKDMKNNNSSDNLNSDKNISNKNGSSILDLDDDDLNTFKSKNTKEKKKILLETKKRQQKTKKILISIILALCLVGLAFSGIKIAKWIKDNNETNKSIDKINDIVEVKEIDDVGEIYSEEDEEVDKQSPYWYYINMPLIDVNLDELKKINSDTIGWIKVNGTNINYPFVQTTDNDYYLTHSFEKTKNEAGWVFADYRNNFSKLDKNNIIYAHGRINSTMFGTLKNVLNKKWYTNKDNSVIRLSTESSNTSWQVFSIYHIKTTNDYIKTYFANGSAYKEFLNMLAGRSIYNFNVELGENDKILTLSTCYNKTDKLVVHAKLIKIENK